MEEKDFIKMMVDDIMDADHVTLEQKHGALDALQQDIDLLDDADEKQEMQEFLNEHRNNLNK